MFGRKQLQKDCRLVEHAVQKWMEFSLETSGSGIQLWGDGL